MMKPTYLLPRQQDVFITDWLHCAFQDIIKSSIEKGGRGRLSVSSTFTLCLALSLYYHIYSHKSPGGNCYYALYCIDMEMNIKEHSQFAHDHTGNQENPISSLGWVQSPQLSHSRHVAQHVGLK